MPIRPGDTVGQYEILAELGRGGMATVYRARQGAVGRDVAIKVLPEQFLHDSGFLARFTNEARVIAGLEHRSILPVYDYGEAGGVPYIVMRLMPHGSLRSRLAAGPLPPAEAAQAITQIAEALDYAHARGVIHRDLKPDNVLLDDQGHAYLADFGIAKVLEAATQTSGARFVGTPTYMAPEQARGGRPSPATDIYALGAMAFEMLAGRPPFVADEFVALLFKHVSEAPPPLRDLVPGLPAAAEAAVARALAKDPQARFATAREFADAFARGLAEQSPAAPAAASAPPPARALTPPPSWPPGDQTVSETPLPVPAPGASWPPSAAPGAGRRGTAALWAGLGLGGCLAVLVAVGALFAFRGALGGLLPGATLAQFATHTRLPGVPAETRTPLPTQPAPATAPAAQSPTPASAAGQGGLIRIALQMPLSGPLEGFGRPAANGAELAFEQQSPGLMELGYEVELLALDDGGNPDTAVGNAAQVAADSAALCVVGHFTSTASMPASEVYAENGLAMVSPASSDPRLTEHGLANVFRVIGRDDVEALVAAQFAREELDAATAYIAFDDMEIARLYAEQFAGAASLAGLEVLGVAGPLSPGGYAGSLAEAREGAPDVLFFSGAAQAARQYFTAARAAGVGAAFMGPSLIGWPELAGASLGQTYFSTQAADAAAYPGRPRFRADYEARFGEPPTVFSALAYDAMTLCLDAAQHAAEAAGQIPSRAAVVQAVRDAHLEGVTGPLGFRPNGDRAEAPYFMVEVTATTPDEWPDNPVLGPFFLPPP